MPTIASAGLIINGTQFDDRLNGTAGDDTQHGNAGNDTLFAGKGNDILFGDDGNDTIIMNAHFTADDVVDGGAGTDALYLKGGGDFVLSNVHHVEGIILQRTGPADFHPFHITTVSSTVSGTNRLSIDGYSLYSKLVFDGTAEKHGSFSVRSSFKDDVLKGGHGADRLDSGNGQDHLRGGEGGDVLVGGFGTDVFLYKGVQDSNESAADQLQAFQARQDKIDLPETVSAIDHRITVDTFDGNLSTALAAVTADNLGAGHAVLVFSAHEQIGRFLDDTAVLVVDANGVAGYQAGEDYVMLLTQVSQSHIGALSTANFI
jgi:Ca2+-binding RTX toxin-like protein